jgi:hypothetical protein
MGWIDDVETQVHLASCSYARRSQAEQLRRSQALIAPFLAVPVRTKHAWELGVLAHRNISSRIMAEIRRDPEDWRERLRGSTVVR